MIAQTLHRDIAAVCPIFGVSIGNDADKGTWLVSFKPEATASQRAAAQAVIDNFDLVAFRAAQSAEATRKQAIHDDPLRVDILNWLKNADASDISAYVNNNVTDLASAKTMLARIIFLIALDARNGG